MKELNNMKMRTHRTTNYPVISIVSLLLLLLSSPSLLKPTNPPAHRKLNNRITQAGSTGAEVGFGCKDPNCEICLMGDTGKCVACHERLGYVYYFDECLTTTNIKTEIKLAAVYFRPLHRDIVYSIDREVYFGKNGLSVRKVDLKLENLIEKKDPSFSIESRRISQRGDRLIIKLTSEDFRYNHMMLTFNNNRSTFLVEKGLGALHIIKETRIDVYKVQYSILITILAVFAYFFQYLSSFFLQVPFVRSPLDDFLTTYICGVRKMNYVDYIHHVLAWRFLFLSSSDEDESRTCVEYEMTNNRIPFKCLLLQNYGEDLLLFFFVSFIVGTIFVIRNCKLNVEKDEEVKEKKRKSNIMVVGAIFKFIECNQMQIIFYSLLSVVNLNLKVFIPITSFCLALIFLAYFLVSSYFIYEFCESLWRSISANQEKIKKEHKDCRIGDILHIIAPTLKRESFLFLAVDYRIPKSRIRAWSIVGLERIRTMVYIILYFTAGNISTVRSCIVMVVELLNFLISAKFDFKVGPMSIMMMYIRIVFLLCASLINVVASLTQDQFTIQYTISISYLVFLTINIAFHSYLTVHHTIIFIKPRSSTKVHNGKTETGEDKKVVAREQGGDQVAEGIDIGRGRDGEVERRVQGVKRGEVGRGNGSDLRYLVEGNNDNREERYRMSNILEADELNNFSYANSNFPFIDNSSLEENYGENQAGSGMHMLKKSDSFGLQYEDILNSDLEDGKKPKGKHDILQFMNDQRLRGVEAANPALEALNRVQRIHLRKTKQEVMLDRLKKMMNE